MKAHYETLDGLRGVAALAVVVFHFSEWVQGVGTKNLLPHAYLAVDFFFCLSGFVVAYAYDPDRMRTLGAAGFLNRRAVRLHPLVVLGALLGVVQYFLSALLFGRLVADPSQLLLVGLAGLLLVPTPSLPGRFGSIFSFNPPAWSLFWEYVANLLYGLLLWRAARWQLVLLCAASAVGIYCAASLKGELSIGFDIETFWWGVPRVLFSFVAGVLVQRFALSIRNPLGFWGLSIILLATFLCPFPARNEIMDTALVLFLFPLVIMLGVGGQSSRRGAGLIRLSGRLSYPLYMTHYSVVFLFADWKRATKPDDATVLAMMVVGTLAAVGLAWVAMRFYDEPLRARLARRRAQRGMAAPAPGAVA